MMKIASNKIKETIIGIVLACLVSVVPFYFETKAMSNANYLLNTEQEISIKELETETVEIKLKQAVEKSEIEHNKEILLRIEKKVDELKKEVQALD